MASLRSGLLIVLAACGTATEPAPVVPQQPLAMKAPAPELDTRNCVTVQAQHLIGEYTFTATDAEVVVYHVKYLCIEVVGRVSPEGAFASAQLHERQDADVPDLSVETVLKHGDRLHRAYRWSGSTYVPFGPALGAGEF